MAYIQQNYAQTLSISTLANEVYLNPDYLGRIFRDVTGTTVSAMIQKVRMDHVCGLLSTTNRTVTDIAAACGFTNLRTFDRVFCERCGCTPRDFRKSFLALRREEAEKK